MNIVVDENIPKRTVDWLLERGHTVRDLRGTPEQGASDERLWDLAQGAPSAPRLHRQSVQQHASRAALWRADHPTQTAQPRPYPRAGPRRDRVIPPGVLAWPDSHDARSSPKHPAKSSAYLTRDGKNAPQLKANVGAQDHHPPRPAQARHPVDGVLGERGDRLTVVVRRLLRCLASRSTADALADGCSFRHRLHGVYVAVSARVEVRQIDEQKVVIVLDRRHTGRPRSFVHQATP